MFVMLDNYQFEDLFNMLRSGKYSETWTEKHEGTFISVNSAKSFVFIMSGICHDWMLVPQQRKNNRQESISPPTSAPRLSKMLSTVEQKLLGHDRVRSLEKEILRKSIQLKKKENETNKKLQMINSDFLDSTTKEEDNDYFQLQNKKEIELI